MLPPCPACGANSWTLAFRRPTPTAVCRACEFDLLRDGTGEPAGRPRDSVTDRDARGRPISYACPLQDYVPHRTVHYEYLARIRAELVREERAYGLQVRTLALGRRYLASPDRVLRQLDAPDLLVPRHAAQG